MLFYALIVWFIYMKGILKCVWNSIPHFWIRFANSEHYKHCELFIDMNLLLVTSGFYPTTSEYELNSIVCDNQIIP